VISFSQLSLPEDASLPVHDKGLKNALQWLCRAFFFQTHSNNLHRKETSVVRHLFGRTANTFAVR
jgi:hypothetical protein